jgi:hypothetical protein
LNKIPVPREIPVKGIPEADGLHPSALAVGGRMLPEGEVMNDNERDHLTRESIREQTNPADPNRLTAEERYLRDPMFHALVDMLRGAILHADYTPTEIREAAMLAAIMVEMRRPARPIFLPTRDFEGEPTPRCSRCHRADCWADVNGTAQCQNCGTYGRKLCGRKL